MGKVKIKLRSAAPAVYSLETEYGLDEILCEKKVGGSVGSCCNCNCVSYSGAFGSRRIFSYHDNIGTCIFVGNIFAFGNKTLCP